jgi:UDP-N-acetylglucosamine acyltransferase
MSEPHVDPSAQVHPSAVVHPSARVGAGARIGPFAVVGEHVEVGAETEIRSHAVIEGPTTLGPRNIVFPFASLGTAPQDLKWRGEPTTLHIGEGNQFREFTTVNRGTVGGGGKTRIGDHNLFMAYVHVAHDCAVGSRTVFANNATLAGHVVVDDFVVLGGMAAIGQFVRIGESAFLGAGAMVSLDVPPYCLAQGDRARLLGLNVVGLRRRGISKDRIHELQSAYRIAFRSGLTLEEACSRISDEIAESPEVQRFVRFLRSSEKGITR